MLKLNEWWRRAGDSLWTGPVRGRSAGNEQPLRAELFNLAQLQQHAEALARRHDIDQRGGADRLLHRLRGNEAVLVQAYELISAAVTAKRHMSAADEWLLDNFYIVEEQIRTARLHLPKHYSRELPQLKHGPAAGFPRVYEIALELISHVDGRVTAEGLTHFVDAYQLVTPLKLGELWAIPIMLRLALIENLRRVAARTIAARLQRDAASGWADRLLKAAETDPRSLIVVMAEMTGAAPDMSSEFLAEFARRLQGHPDIMVLPLVWLEQRLAEQTVTIEQHLQIEGQQQAADQVSIGNSISSLRFLGTMDWREFVDAHSFVERVLRGDPPKELAPTIAGDWAPRQISENGQHHRDIYGQMDFATRDQYRHVVERLARQSPCTEWDVAAAAVNLARRGVDLTAPHDRSAHVGYFLIDRGLPQLEAIVQARIPILDRLRRPISRRPLAAYLGVIGAIALALVSLVMFPWQRTPALALVPIALLGFLAAVHLSVALVNWLVTVLIRPRSLPRMDFSDGIPDTCRTLVVVPTMLSGQRAIDDLLESIEVRYLANRDDHLHFALLTDWRDADAQVMPDDEMLLDRVCRGIATLNQKYKSDRSDIFYVFHRPRRWNEQERLWMGYERKRGKLAELNAFLRGGPPDRFMTIVGDATSLRAVKYVITLDSDTQLPRDAARQLIATLAHPLNRPCVDAQRQIVIDGYAILQPRVGLSFPDARRSRFAELFGGQPGIDPYTRAVSDVYQDLFREGSFIGKGIYDLDAFERALKGRFPENRILSHDLIEGCHARSGLVSDIELFESYPARYNADAVRRHRWIRGDWQIARWVLPRVSDGRGRLVANPLSALSRWKILDNLRRSLTPAALVVLLTVVWMLPGAAPWIGTALVLAVLWMPAMLQVVVEAVRRPPEAPWRAHLRAARETLGRSAAHAVCGATFLADEAYYSSEAIARTLIRLTVTRRNLLQWHTFADAEQAARTDLIGTVRAMWFSPVLALVLGAMLAFARPAALPAAAFLLILWLLSPAIAWWLSLPRGAEEARLAQADKDFLEETARKTWRFFETFMEPQDNWLPPDNYQEYPAAVIAHRTSPTNIGLALLSNLAAYDFGFISAGELADRIGKTFESMDRLQRYHGHFLNWYDTRTLQPLHPRYVSSVDSGNLSATLLTLRVGLLQLTDREILPPAAWQGLRITARVLRSAYLAAEDGAVQSQERPLRVQTPLAAALAAVEQDLARPPSSLAIAAERLARLAAFDDAALAAIRTHPDEQVRAWTSALARQAQAWLDELHLLAPTVGLPARPPTVSHQGLPETVSQLDGALTLRAVAQLNPDSLFGDGLDGAADEDRQWLTQFRERVRTASRAAGDRLASHERLAAACLEFSDAQFDFLFDKSRKFLSIGFNVDDRRLDGSYYDLLASEARLASFVAVAQGQLGPEHWFALGRTLTRFGGDTTLLSWSGSMFEYLMPLLVMPCLEGTLLDQTCKVAVARQIDYGASRNVPWGISESGYNLTDIHLNYQYRAFGVPGLGFKRGLGEDLVIAPYASLIALPVAPAAACANLRAMAAAGFEGRYGFYEAIDYTPSRVPRGQSFAVVRSFMAHHQGMAFLSLANVLRDRAMQRRFAEYPPFQATELLLHERIPKSVPVFPHTAETSRTLRPAHERQAQMRVFTSPDTPLPEVHLLSNGRYHVMITNAGSGYSRWKELAVTRWHEDLARDSDGLFCYLRDVASNDVWSAGFQPSLQPSKSYEAIFLQSRAEYRRRDFGVDTHTEVTVSPEDDVELRRIRVTNDGHASRTIELTSYAEVVLAHAAADATHRAFSNLFVQTEIVRNREAILCTRRPRSHDERPPWMFHLMAVHGKTAAPTSFETDRSRFLGRGRDIADAQAMIRPAPLTNSEGSVLDPIVTIRSTISLAAGEAAVIDLVTGVAESRDAALALVEKYRDRHLADRLLDLAWTHGQVVLQQLNVSEAEAQLFGRLASSIIYASGRRRASARLLAKNTRGQSGLWGYGISGDFPIVLLRVADANRIELVRQLVRAHAYWRFKGLSVDLVIWNEDQSGYRQDLHDKILSIIAASTEAHAIDRPGGIFVRRPEQMSDDDRTLMQAAARVILSDSAGQLVDQIERRGRTETTVPALVPTRDRRFDPRPAKDQARPKSLFDNGWGGFSADGREYVMTIDVRHPTPAPWINVLANPRFGTIVSESGGGYTWLENAHEFRLTPWYNDPVSDRGGELFYLRDEETGRFWSPTPQPAGGRNAYTVRHGFGYSVFETVEHGIASELTMHVALDAPVKFWSLKLSNDSDSRRHVSVTCCLEWVLAELRAKSLMHVVTEVDTQTGALLARNPYNMEFPGWVAFLEVSRSQRTVTGDRTEFLGRNSSAAQPAAMKRSRLSGKVGAGLDPCGAMQTYVDLAPGEVQEIAFVLGAGTSLDEARDLIRRHRGLTAAAQSLQAVRDYWQRTLEAVTIETPDRAVDLLANGWLIYQTLACRLWARSGYYQSGGAYGFRDQLQDVMALVHTEPRLTREHLLRAAARQFVEGDVQHWWHPPSGRGVRTRFSDDYLWLPLVASRYVQQTGDADVLDTRIAFLQGRPLNANEEAYYDLPGLSEESATLYEHCVRAVRYGLRFGNHGLPLMGCGDWNDGMNRVGHEGRGESVWLAFFLFRVLREFAEIARLRGDTPFAETCDMESARLQANIETHAWDGGWYRRAYFDDGQPLGSAVNLECQIDALPQSWAVLSGAGDPQRAQMAMQAVDDRLVRRDQSLIQLFDPPFDKSPLDPGYIKGYVPGVRENGGQYTHAAIWTIMAFAALGDRQRAWELMSLINPIRHGSTPEGIATYKVEPYVVAADVYAVPPHTGRGGWTWYTGSAGWMYQLIIESLLGLRRERDTLSFRPCLPEAWPSVKVRYRHHSTMYQITITNRGGREATRVTVDGVEQAEPIIRLDDDHGDHLVQVDIG